MKQRKYLQPKVKFIDLNMEQLIATSGDADITIPPSPWESNKRDTGNSMWEESQNGNESIWK